MKKSLFVYNEGTLQRHDNTIRFIDKAGNKKDIPIETVGEINIMTQMEFNTSFLNILSQISCQSFDNKKGQRFLRLESLPLMFNFLAN